MSCPIVKVSCNTTIDNIKLQDAIDQFESVKSNKSLISNSSIWKRKEHSFIVTTNRMDTQKELDAISTNIYVEYIIKAWSTFRFTLEYICRVL
jgi:hypothetical protein